VQTDGKAIITSMDMTDSMMFSDEAYMYYFRNTAGNPIYTADHAKIVAMREAIREIKGDAAQNKVVLVHKQSTGGLSVEKELVTQDVYKANGDIEQLASRAFHIGSKKNPQSMVHVEAKAPSSGFWARTGDFMNDMTFGGGGGGGGGSGWLPPWFSLGRQQQQQQQQQNQQRPPPPTTGGPQPRPDGTHLSN
jgi:hypothetical protein